MANAVGRAAFWRLSNCTLVCSIFLKYQSMVNLDKLYCFHYNITGRFYIFDQFLPQTIMCLCVRIIKGEEFEINRKTGNSAAFVNVGSYGCHTDRL